MGGLHNELLALAGAVSITQQIPAKLDSFCLYILSYNIYIHLNYQFFMQVVFILMFKYFLNYM